MTSYCFAEQEVPQIFGKDLGVEICFETSYITYTEPGVMREKGFMYGVSIEARGNMGQVDYHSGSSGDMENIDDNMWEARGLDDLPL